VGWVIVNSGQKPRKFGAAKKSGTKIAGLEPDFRGFSPPTTVIAREVALDPAGKVPKRQVSNCSGSRAAPFSIPF